MPETSPMGYDPKKGWASEEAEDKFVKENKKELYSLRKCINDMPAKHRIALEYLHMPYGGTYDDNLIESLAKVGVKIDEDEEHPGLAKVEQLKPLEDEAFSIIEKKLGISREEATKMMEVFHNLP